MYGYRGISYFFRTSLNITAERVKKRLSSKCVSQFVEACSCLLYTSTKGKTLVADVSSCFLSEPVDVSKYGIIYGGVQKNIGPAGMVILSLIHI